MTQQHNRSLEMVISAPIDDLAQALHTLEKGGWFARERIKVKTRAISPALVEFEVKLSIKHGKGRSNTPLRGTLLASDEYDTTSVSAEVPPKHGQMLLVGLIFAAMLIIWLPLMLSATGAWFMIVPVIVMAINLWFVYNNDLNDTQRVLTLVERTLRLTADRKKHHYAGYDNENPFYDEDEAYSGNIG